MPEKQCLTCRTTKPAAAFSSAYAKRCDACKADPPPPKRYWKPRACHTCFEVKPPEAFAWGDGARTSGDRPHHRRRKHNCRDCEARAAAEREQRAAERRATWEEGGLVVRRCGSCREAKPLEAGFYVNSRRDDGTAEYRYYCKACDTERVQRRIAEIRSDPVAAAELRRKHRELQASWRRRHPGANAAATRRYREAVKRDPERAARYREAQRINHRLQRERKTGQHVGDIRTVSTVQMPSSRREASMLPAGPLVALLDRYIENHARYRNIGDGSALETVCAWADIDPRQLYAWQTGEIAEVQLGTADRVMTGLGVLWWEVYDPADYPEEHERARFVFEGDRRAA